jgi:hypothetical protein
MSFIVSPSFSNGVAVVIGVLVTGTSATGALGASTVVSPSSAVTVSVGAASLPGVNLEALALCLGASVANSSFLSLRVK